MAITAKTARSLTALIQENDITGLKARLSSSPPRHELQGAFLWACNRGHEAAVVTLIDGGVDVNLTDQFGASALHHAVQGQRPSVVELLVKSGADFQSWLVEGESLLHWAARCGHASLAKTLVERGASLESSDGFGRFPLHTACLHGQPEMVPVLLSRAGKRQWHSLSEESETDFCRGAGIGPDLPDQNGWTPLHYACTSYSGSPAAVVKELMEEHADPLLPTPNEKSALDLAFESGRDHLFLACLGTSEILALLTSMDSIQPTLRSPDKQIQSPGGFESVNEERGNMTRVRRHYSFLHDDFHRMSRRSRVIRGRLEEEDPHSKIKEWSLTTIWRHILHNDDVELLEILRDFRVHESHASSFNNFEDAYNMEPHILSDIHLSCFENGLAIFSFIKGHFREQLDSKNYLDIFVHLTKFDGAHVAPELVDKHTVMWPVHCSVLFIALLCGRLKVVECLLRMRQFDVLPSIFVAILIIRRLAKDSAFTDQVKTSLYEFSGTLETMAVDVLNRTFLKDNSEAKYSSISFINTPMGVLAGSTIIDVAAAASCETFLSLPCSQVVLYNLWHGDLHWLPSSWKLFSKLCPLLMPLYFASKRTQERRTSAYSRKISSFDNSRVEYVSVHVHGKQCGSQRFEESTYGSMKDKLRLVKSAFTAPVNKFIFHSVFHFIFLVMFSYVLLYEFRYKMSIVEMICYSFIFGYTIEEGRQIVLQGKEKKMKAYFDDTWNKFDLVAIILSLTGFAIRLYAASDSSDTSNASEEVLSYGLFAARIVLLSGLLIFYMRILFVFSLFSRLGPKLRMMFAMIWYDLLPMLCIFLLFFVSFGITFQGILFPNGYDLTKRTFNESEPFERQKPPVILSNIVRTSFYGMLAAEYNVQLLESTDFTCNGSKSCILIVSVGRNLILYGFHILYVLIVNIMLVNLLIALYSNTVAHINEKSMAHWLADKYSLAHEFRQRSVCPPPFNVFSIVAEMIMLCVKRRRKNYITKKAACGCKTLRFLLIQAFALRGQRFKVGQSRGQGVSEITDRLTAIEKQLASLKTLIQGGNVRRRNLKMHHENERVVVC